MAGRAAEAALFRPAQNPPVRSLSPDCGRHDGPNGEELDTTAIITTQANRTVAAVHDRMPVIVAPEAFNLWLDCTSVDATTASALIVPAPEALLECCEDPPAVNGTPDLFGPDVTGQASVKASLVDS